jgi:hypothetical protein
MIHTCGYLVIEKSDELRFSQIKDDLRLCGGVINGKNLPKRFPMCYKRIESFDSHFCDSWIPCDIQECIEEYESFITMHQNQLKEIKEKFNNERG